MSGARALPGRFEVVRLLGRGGLAEVYLARDRERGGEEVAVKLLRRQFLSMPEVRKRFEREVRIMSLEGHPHLLRVFDFDLSVASPWLSMEVIQGADLDEALRVHGPMAPARVARLAREVGGAVDHLHGQGVIHRDLKPANLMLRGDGSAVVMDLGLASLHEATMLTETGQLLGTPRYFPPEVLLGKGWSGAGDQFQLAAIVFEAVTGERLIPGDDIESLTAAIRSGAWRPFPEGSPAPEGMREAIRRAADPDPAARFPDCASFARALADSGYRRGGSTAVLAPTDLSDPAARVPGRGRRTPLLVAGFLALMLLGALLPLGGGRPEAIRYRVVGDAAVVDFRVEDPEGVRLEVAGVPQEVAPEELGEGRWRLAARALDPEASREVRLVWPGGRGEPFPARAEPLAVREDLRPAARRRLRVEVRRACRARWSAGEWRDLEPGEALLDAPPVDAESWVLELEEEGLAFRIDRAPAQVLGEAFEELESRVSHVDVPTWLRDLRRGAPGSAENLAAYQRAWSSLEGWLPALFAALDPWRAGRLWGYGEQRRRLLHALRAEGRPVEGWTPERGQVGSAYPGRPPGEWPAAEAVMTDPSGLARRAGTRQMQLRTRGSRFGVSSASTPEATFLWPELGGDPEGDVHVSLWIRRLPADVQLRVRSDEPERSTWSGSWLHPDPSPGVDPESFAADNQLDTFTRVLPGAVAPPPGTRMRVELVGLAGAAHDTAWVGEVVRLARAPR